MVAAKRSTERRRRNKVEGLERVEVPGTVAVPEADPSWHPIAARWYTALAESGQARWYEPSDWALAAVGAEVLSRQLNSGERMSGQMIATWLQMASELLTSEMSRRRAKVEIERAQPDGLTVAAPEPAAPGKSNPRNRLAAVTQVG